MLKQHLEKIANFREVTIQGSVLGATKTLRRFAAGLFKSLKVLEEARGERLLTRHSRGIELTGAEKILFAYAERLAREVNDVEARMKSKNAISDIVTIGAYETLGVSFWPQSLRKLKVNSPN